VPSHRLIVALFAAALLAAAVTWLHPAVARAGDPEALWIRGRAALEAGDFEAAREDFEHLADGYPKHPRTPDALIEIARLTADPDSARAIYERIADQYGRTPAGGEALLSIAQADYAAGRYDLVVSRLRPAAGNRYSTDLRRRALLLLGDASLRTQNWKQAAEYYAQVRELSPLPLEDERAVLGLAQSAHAAGDLHEESRVLELGAESHPDGDLEPVLLWEWARSLEAQGLHDAARERMQELVDHFPATPEGAAARDALSPEDGEKAGALPVVIEQHGEALTNLNSASDSTGVAAQAGAAVSGAASDSGSQAGAAAAAADTGARASRDSSAAGESFVVRTGRFARWTVADSLRAVLASAIHDSLGVSPGQDGAPPFAVQSRRFAARELAEALATRMESFSGFLSVVVPVLGGGAAGE